MTRSRLDPASPDALFRQLARELWLVTAHEGQRGGGLIATWVSQASIDPQTPTVATAIAINHFTRELIDASGSFALHLLRPQQLELVWRFALVSGHDVNKLAGLAWEPGAWGAPLVEGCLAQLDCRVYDRHDGGDRVYYWADVLSCRMDAKAVAAGTIPLTDRQMLSLASDEQKAALKTGMLADAEIQRPLLAEYKEKQATKKAP